MLDCFIVDSMEQLSNEAMKKISLKVDKRTVFGKKVKALRKEGILPGSIYGKGIKSLSVQVPVKEFEKTYKEVGETGLVEISLDSDPSTGSGQGKSRPVLIKNVQLDPRTMVAIHADFYQVNLAEKIKASVPVEPIGEPKAVLDKIGLLEVPMSEVEVEALPTDLPEKLEVDVANLSVIGDQITVGDVKTPSGVTILTDAGQILFKIGELVSKEAEELAKAEEAEKAAAAAEAVEAAGEAPTVEGAAAEGTEAVPADLPAGKAGGEKPQEAPKEAAGKTKPEEKPQ